MWYSLISKGILIYTDKQSLALPILRVFITLETDRLLAFYLHGSAARGDMRSGSDIDSIAIVDEVDTVILEAIRSTQSRFKDLSISVYSASNVHQYPSFRTYALINGTKRVYGNLALEMKPSLKDDVYGIINNLFAIRQIARSYLISGTYGHRSHYMLGLMMKLTDHGCLCPLQILKSGFYPTKKTQVLEYYKDNEILTDIIKYTQNLKECENTLRQKLLIGNRTELENLFYLLLDACVIVAGRLNMVQAEKSIS
ncbi:nucleotidyltransferase domain-containing protein [Photorhabdus antumapuensis]|uniref:nucleotidyltransferase domain-containing protein n=1 Tax=Photorhabdus antumapuensis TaxID=2862867 RepID=UPI001CED000A|nr:nucleotidyltransferase domain-containing protein [Photorhabdus antumapuensis]